MGFYDLPKRERQEMVQQIEADLDHALETGQIKEIERYAANSDTHIRKNTYLILGRFYYDQPSHRNVIIQLVNHLICAKDENVRQTAVYTLGEIGKIDGEKAVRLLEVALKDKHHSVRNAVIGAIKQMGEKNPKPTLSFAKKFLHHPDPVLRREIIHGIELRGRSHPEEILPLLRELENDPDRKVRGTIIHVIGQISYKKGCLEKVVSSLGTWNNKELVSKAAAEIVDVHERYEKFSARSYKEAEKYLEDKRMGEAR